MTRIVFDTADGPIGIETDEDISVMRIAKAYDVAGIDGDCGGEMVCGTCHVFVDAADFAAFSPPGEMEAMILECVPNPQPNARLSCQLRARDCPDGIRFTVPPAQR